MTGDAAASAERMLASYRRRAEHFGVLNDGFGDPAWLMLLRLFIDDELGRATTIGELLNEVGGDAALARTYIGFLKTHEVVNGPDFCEILRGFDRNSAVRLTDRGRAMMKTYFAHDA